MPRCYTPRHSILILYTMLDFDTQEPPIDTSTVHRLMYGIYDYIHRDLPVGESMVTEIDPEKRAQLESMGPLFDGETSLVTSFDWDNNILTVMRVDNRPSEYPPINFNAPVVLRIMEYSPSSVAFALITDQETIDRYREFTLLRGGRALVEDPIESAYDLQTCSTRCIASSWDDINATTVIIDNSGPLLTQVAHIGES